MELKDYLKIITSSWSFILGVTVVTTLVFTIWSIMQPLRYDASNTIVVHKPDQVAQKTAAFYQYDKYYSIQASSLYADILASWLASPDTAKEIFEQADYPVPDVSLKKLTKIFKPRRQPPVTISVTIRDQDKEKAERLVNGAIEVLKNKVTLQQSNEVVGENFAIFNGKTIVVPARVDLLLNMVLGLIAGLLLGFTAAFTRQYLRS